MASTEECWIEDIINDFIHSSIWLSPIQTFVDANCACFGYDDEKPLSSSLLNEQKSIFKQYQHIADSLINSLCIDLKLDINQVRDFCQRSAGSSVFDESHEQIYSTNDFYLFTEMMKRKNLILQLQALVNIQIECGTMTATDANDDQVLQLLLKATASSSIENLTGDPSTFLLDSRQKDTTTINTDWHRQATTEEIRLNSQPKTINSVSEEMLLEKLKELTVHTGSSADDETASAISSRESFLKQQRDLIIQQQRLQRAQELEKESLHVRPQSAAKIARKVMETTNKQQQQISDDELQKRRIMAAKLRREVVDKH